MMSERESHSRNASLTTNPQSPGTSTESSGPHGSVTNYLLQLLNNASNETAAATLVGLTILTYFVFGRLGLLLIGFVGGIVLHASWEVKQCSNSTQLRLQKRKQSKTTGLEVVDTLLHWRSDVNTTSKQESEAEDVNQENAYDAVNLKALPKTADAIEKLKDAILQNFVMWAASLCVSLATY